MIKIGGVVLIAVVMHNVQGCPRFARIDGRGTFYFVPRLPTILLQMLSMELGTPTIPTTEWLRAIMRLEDQKLKQARCNSERFQVTRAYVFSCFN